MKKLGKIISLFLSILIAVTGTVYMPSCEAAETSYQTVYAGEKWTIDYQGEVRWIESSDYKIVTADYSTNRVTVTFKALRTGDARVSVYRKYAKEPVTYQIHVVDNSGLFTASYVGKDKSSLKYVWEIHNNSNINFRNVRFSIKYPGKKGKNAMLRQGLMGQGTGIVIKRFEKEYHAWDAVVTVTELVRESFFSEGSKLQDQVSLVMKQSNYGAKGTKYDFYINNTSKVRPDVTIYAYVYDSKTERVIKTLECTYYHEVQGMKREPATIQINNIRGERLSVKYWCSAMM